MKSAPYKTAEENEKTWTSQIQKKLFHEINSGNFPLQRYQHPSEDKHPLQGHLFYVIPRTRAEYYYFFERTMLERSISENQIIAIKPSSGSCLVAETENFSSYEEAPKSSKRAPNFLGNALIQSYKKMVFAILNRCKFILNSRDIDDFSQEIWASFWVSLKKYQSEGISYSFSTYFWNRANWDLIRYLKTRYHLIRIPGTYYSKQKIIQDFVSQFRSKYHRAPVALEIANHLEISESRLRKLKAALGIQKLQTLNFSDSEDESGIQEPYYLSDVLDHIQASELTEIALQQIDQISERRTSGSFAKQIFLNRVGITEEGESADTLDYESIGFRFGVTRQRAKNLERDIMPPVRACLLKALNEV